MGKMTMISCINKYSNFSWLQAESWSWSEKLQSRNKLPIRFSQKTFKGAGTFYFFTLINYNPSRHPPLLPLLPGGGKYCPKFLLVVVATAVKVAEHSFLYLCFIRLFL